MNNNEEKASEEEVTLSPQQRRSIEELVQLSPPVIKARVRRDALSAAEVLGVYTGFSPSSDSKDEPLIDLHPLDM